MKYLKFKINNFRGIKSLEIELPETPKIITLIGLNESGKTTILEALNYFKYNPESLEPLEIKGYGIKDPNSLIPISQKANFNGSITIEATVRLDAVDIRAVSKHLVEHGVKETDLSPKDFTITQELKFLDSVFTEAKNTWSFAFRSKSGKQRTMTNATPPQWQAAVNFLKDRLPSLIYFPTFSLDFPEKIYLENAPADTKKHQFFTRVIQDVLDSMNNGSNVESHISRRLLSDKEHDKTPLDGTLLAVGRTISNSVFNAWNKVFNRPSTMTRVGVIGGVDDTPNGKAPYLQFRVEDSDGFYFLSERSVGFRWFFSFLLLTQFRAYRQNSNKNAIFLFDEPASNLHPIAQTRLLGSLPMLLDAGTVVYTTHSHHLINPDWLGFAYVVKNQGTSPSIDPITDFSETDITATLYSRFVHNHPDQSFFFKPVLDVLEYVPKLLDDVGPAIFLEGKSDFYAMRLATRVNARSVSLMPGLGAGSLDTLIRLYAGWGRNFVILLDSDAEGAIQKKRYHDIFGPMVAGRIFTYEDIDASLKRATIENLISKSDKESLRTIFFNGQSALSKKNLLSAIQQACADSREFKFDEETQNKLDLVLDFLEENLRRLSPSIQPTTGKPSETVSGSRLQPA